MVTYFVTKMKTCSPMIGQFFFHKMIVASIGLLDDPVTWYGINYAGTQVSQEFSKQRKVGLDWYEFLCVGSPTALFVSQHNLFRTM